MRLRKKPNRAMRLQRCAYLLIAEPEALRGRWLGEHRYEALHVELGCGKGRFTAEIAKAKTEVFVVGIEKLPDALLTALERTHEEGVQNLRFINALADNLADYFAPGEVSCIYINFCDPWPASKHEKRRLTSRSFLEMYMQILSPDGEIHFKTDNLSLFEFSLCEFELRGFKIMEVDRDLHKSAPTGIMTDYEQKFHEQGLPIYYVRVARS